VITDTRITVVGNLGEDPELRFTPSGAAVATFSVAVTPRRLDKTKGEWIDGDATWYRINCWRSLAENVAESLTKGSRVIVVGTLAARSWKNETKGTEGVSWEITAEAIGPDLQWQTAKPVKSSKSRPDRDVPPPDDPWSGSAPAAGSAAQSAAAGSWGGGYSDEPPF
jgi:single-strand DNA-binding protein